MTKKSNATPLPEKTWLGQKVKYSNGAIVTVIDEDATHVLIQFESGAKIVTAKSGVKKIE